MLKIKKIDHVAVAVTDVDEALARYERLFGIQPGEREVVASQKTEAALLPFIATGPSSSSRVCPVNPGVTCEAENDAGVGAPGRRHRRAQPCPRPGPA